MQKNMKRNLNIKNTKTKFLVFGTINIIIIKLYLLFVYFFDVSISTLISQFANVLVGYNLYSRYVFNYRKYFLIVFSSILSFLYLLGI